MTASMNAGEVGFESDRGVVAALQTRRSGVCSVRCVGGESSATSRLALRVIG